MKGFPLSQHYSLAHSKATASMPRSALNLSQGRNTQQPKQHFIFFFCPGNMMDLEATALFCKLSSLQHVLAASIPRDKHAGFFV